MSREGEGERGRGREGGREGERGREREREKERERETEDVTIEMALVEKRGLSKRTQYCTLSLSLARSGHGARRAAREASLLPSALSLLLGRPGGWDPSPAHSRRSATLGWASRTCHSALSPALPHPLSREEGEQALGSSPFLVFLSCFPFLWRVGSHDVAQAGPGPLESRSPPASASLDAGIIGVSHCVWPFVWFLIPILKTNQRSNNNKNFSHLGTVGCSLNKQLGMANPSSLPRATHL